MKNIAFLFLSLFLIAQAAFANNASVFKPLDVFEMEWVSDPQISPDGKQIVFKRNGFDIMTDKAVASLWLINSDGSGLRKLTLRDTNESRPQWSPDSSRIAFTSRGKNGSEIFVYDLASRSLNRLSQLERSPGNLNWSPDGQWIAFTMLVPQKAVKLVLPPQKPKGAKWADTPRVTTRLKHEADGSGYIEPGFHHIFVIPAQGGTARQITSGNFHHRSMPQWSRDGKQLIFSAKRHADWEYKFRNSEIYSVSVKTGEITALTNRNGPDNSPVISPNGRKIAYLTYADKVQTYQINELYVMDLDGSNKQKVAIKLDRNISNIRWDKNGKGLYFQYDNHGNGKIGYTSLSGKTKLITQNVGGTNISRPYGGGQYSLSGSGQIAYTLSSPYHPADLALIKKGGKSKRLVQLNNDILPFRTLGEVKEIWYNSSVDKRKLQGWVVTPPNYDAKKQYPLIVENHGGPIANYGDRFSVEMQLYAAAGYIVFYPNPRGSTSYGEEFGNLLYHNYPGDDYQDVMDGVDALIKQGLAHEGQLYVTGGSAGGIMSAWMIGKNSRFKAAAVVKPVMNWFSKTLTADNYYAYAHTRYPGQPWENMETYMKFSPISLVANIQTPTLVMVGMSDLRTPLSEAKQLYHALKLRKIDTALVEIPGAYHFIGKRPSQQITKIEHILVWFEKYRK